MNSKDTQNNLIFKPSQTILLCLKIFLCSNRMKIRLEMFLGWLLTFTSSFTLMHIVLVILLPTVFLHSLTLWPGRRFHVLIEKKLLPQFFFHSMLAPTPAKTRNKRNWKHVVHNLHFYVSKSIFEVSYFDVWRNCTQLPSKSYYLPENSQLQRLLKL